jgi:hypothetical protein
MEWVAEAAGNRIHGTTRERPMRRFVEVERDLLRPLADTPGVGLLESAYPSRQLPHPVQTLLLLRPLQATAQEALGECYGEDRRDLPQP